MANSTAATALLIFALLIVNEVSSAPREERILQESKSETFKETREAEVLERYSIGINKKFGESKEDEVLQRRARAKEPLPKEPSKDDSKAVSTKKPSTAEKQSETSEAKDMTESFVPPQPDDDSTDSNKTVSTTDNDNKKPATADMSANNNSTGNAADGKENLPPMIFPTAGVRKTSEAEVLKLSHNNKTNGVTDATANKSNDTKSSPAAVEATTTTTVSPVSTTVSPAIVATPEKSSPSTTASSTTQPSVASTAKSTTTTTTEKTIITTEKSPKSDVMTETPVIVVSTGPSKAELQLHAKKVTPMPSGVVALITAIAFAIVAVMAYVGLVVWRRYLEWRYGNRELLVNDFDANDIGNFEL